MNFICKSRFILVTALILFLFSCRKSTSEYLCESKSLCEKLAILTQLDGKYRKVGHRMTMIERQEQLVIDLKNTKELIDIINLCDLWPSKKILGCDEYVSPMLIFRHAPKEYWSEVREIIEVAHDRDELNGPSYEFILNQVNGRPQL